MALVLGGVGLVYGILAALVVAIGVLALAFAARPPKDDERAGEAWIGSDGVSLEGGAFVPYSSVATAAIRGATLVIERRDGGALVLDVAATERDEALARIEAGVRAYAAVADPAAEAMIRCGSDEEVEAWRARIAALAAPMDEGSYRDGALGTDRLWRVLEDPAAHPTARVAAAELLRATSTPSERRLRVAALDDTAHPHVRVALDALGEMDHDGASSLPAARRAPG